MTYAVIDADTMEGHTYKVSRASQSASDHHDIERDTSGADSIVYPPFLDYSTYVQVDNTRGSQDLVRTGVTADPGVYVVAPPERVAARSSASFWIQDKAGVHGSGGSVTYSAGATALKFDFGCPTGVMSNYARAKGARVHAKTRGERDWGAEGEVPRTGHPLFVKFVV